RSFHPPPTSVSYTLSLHDALPILPVGVNGGLIDTVRFAQCDAVSGGRLPRPLTCPPVFMHDEIDIDLHCVGLLPDLADGVALARSEEHTSELQSRENLVCRLLLEK